MAIMEEEVAMMMEMPPEERLEWEAQFVERQLHQMWLQTRYEVCNVGVAIKSQ